jgi:hypothetical protein
VKNRHLLVVEYDAIYPQRRKIGYEDELSPPQQTGTVSADFLRMIYRCFWPLDNPLGLTSNPYDDKLTQRRKNKTGVPPWGTVACMI